MFEMERALHTADPEIEADMRAEVDEEEALIALRRLPDSGVDSVLARFFATRKLYALRRMLNDKQRELPF